MRMAAMRTLVAAMVLVTAVVIVPAALRAPAQDAAAAVFLFPIVATIGILCIWLASLIARRPRAASRLIVPLVIVLLVLPVASQSWDGMRGALHLTAREQAAFDYLRTADELQMPYVGFSPALSRGFVAMRILARSPFADAAFKELLRTGTRPGQIYGLIGVRRTDPLHFAMMYRAYARPKETIPLASGCTLSNVELAPIVETAGALQIAPGQRPDMVTPVPPETELKPPDIAGGGFSAIFLDPGPKEWEAELHAAIATYDFE